jgi:quercetin 2,3-dioxygenase
MSSLSANVQYSSEPLGRQPVAIGKLPGQQSPYALRNGEGQHLLLGDVVVTFIARSQETGGLFEAFILSGSKDTQSPLMLHSETDKALYVMDGQLELFLNGELRLLNRGDYAYIPSQTPHAYRMLSWRTRVLAWTTGQQGAAVYSALGTPFSRPVPPEQPGLTLTRQQYQSVLSDLEILDQSIAWEGAHPVIEADLPSTRQPYVLREGEGERLVAADQVFSFLQTQASSGDRFITVMTEGPAGEAIPPHYHEEHAENFFCIDGHMTMWINGEEIKVLPGDYIQVPAHCVHSYRLDAPYTRFLGWLVPGLFEPFFRLIGDPYEPHLFPLDPPAFRFDRVLANLDTIDLKVLPRQ